MKISYWIPKDEKLDTIRKFLKREVAQAMNIKSKDTRDNTLNCLISIRHTLERFGTGYCFYSDNGATSVVEYEGNIKKYHCGNEFIDPPLPEELT